MKKLHYLWILLPMLFIGLTASMCSADKEDDNNNSSGGTSTTNSNVVGTWVGYQNYSGCYAIFNSDMTGVYSEPDGSYNYTTDFIYKMTSTNEGRIYWVDDGEIYYYEGDGAIKFNINGDKMMVYEYDDDYYYKGGEWELLCILVKEK